MAKSADTEESLSKKIISGLMERVKDADVHQRMQRIPRIPELRNPLVENVERNLASEFYKKLVQWINEFDASLDNAHEVGVRLVSFGQAIVFHLNDVGYWNPSLIIFGGCTEEGEPVQLIQHVSQISILLMKLPRKNPTEPKKPIGFHTEIAQNSNVAVKEKDLRLE
jgi:hypothetical protein